MNNEFLDVLLLQFSCLRKLPVHEIRNSPVQRSNHKRFYSGCVSFENIVLQNVFVVNLGYILNNKKLNGFCLNWNFAETCKIRSQRPLGPDKIINTGIIIAKCGHQFLVCQSIGAFDWKFFKDFDDANSAFKEFYSKMYLLIIDQEILISKSSISFSFMPMRVRKDKSEISKIVENLCDPWKYSCEDSTFFCQKSCVQRWFVYSVLPS